MGKKLRNEVRGVTKQKDDSRGEVVLYQATDGSVELDVRLERESLWLSLNQMAGLFERDKSVISRHLRNVFKEGELERTAVVAKNATTAADGWCPSGICGPDRGAGHPAWQVAGLYGL